MGSHSSRYKIKIKNFITKYLCEVFRTGVTTRDETTEALHTGQVMLGRLFFFFLSKTDTTLSGEDQKLLSSQPSLSWPTFRMWAVEMWRLFRSSPWTGLTSPIQLFQCLTIIHRPVIHTRDRVLQVSKMLPNKSCPEAEFQVKIIVFSICNRELKSTSLTENWN